jgi:sulfur carrier protein ThiS
MYEIVPYNQFDQLQVHLVACTDPFSSAHEDMFISCGGSIVDVLDRSELTFHGPIDAIITLNGDIVPREVWDELLPQNGDFLTLRIVPHSGGGGD